MTFLELKNGERARTNLSMGLGYLGRKHLGVSPVAEPPWPHTGPAAARGLVQLVLNEHAELVPGDPATQWNISLSAARFQSRGTVRLRLAPQTAWGGNLLDPASLDPSGSWSIAWGYVAPHGGKVLPPAQTGAPGPDICGADERNGAGRGL